MASDAAPVVSHITTHVLDTVTGRPAAALWVRLEAETEDGWNELARDLTDEDGRLTRLGPAGAAVGRYRLTFDTAAYFAARQEVPLFSEVTLTFEIRSPDEHLHLPLLLGPFAYSTYRGT